MSSVCTVSLIKKLLRNLGGHIKENYLIGLWYAEFIIFKIIKPGKEVFPFILWKFRALMHRIGGGVSARNDYSSPFIEFSPIFFKGGKAVNRIERGGGIGINVVGTGAELTCKIHFHKCRGVVLIVGEGHSATVVALCFKSLGKTVELGGFSASVKPFNYNKLSHNYLIPL